LIFNILKSESKQILKKLNEIKGLDGLIVNLIF